MCTSLQCDHGCCTWLTLHYIRAISLETKWTSTHVIIDLFLYLHILSVVLWFVKSTPYMFEMYFHITEQEKKFVSVLQFITIWYLLHLLPYKFKAVKITGWQVVWHFRLSVGWLWWLVFIWDVMLYSLVNTCYSSIMFLSMTALMSCPGGWRFLTVKLPCSVTR
jgi:hypothetical protein